MKFPFVIIAVVLLSVFSACNYFDTVSGFKNEDMNVMPEPEFPSPVKSIDADGEPLTGSISNGHGQTFEFYADIGQSFSIVTTGVSGRRILLFNPVDSLINMADDTVGYYNLELSFTAHDEGDYHFVVDGFISENSGSFTAALIEYN